MTQTELAELSDRELKKRVSAAEKTLRELEALPAAQVVRERRGEETLRQMDEAFATIVETRAELAERSPQKIVPRLPLAREMRDRADARKAREPVMRAFRYVIARAHPELQGSTLAADRLSAEEGAELIEIVKKLKALARDESPAPKDKARYEQLVGKAAGNEHIFEHGRQKAELRKKIEEIKEEQRVNALPKRPIFEEPGSVTLPRQVFEWLEAASDSNWTVADVGALVAFLGMWENRSPELIPGSRFEDVDGELELVVPGGWDGLRFRSGSNGDALTGGDSGSVREREALGTLARNGWFDGTLAGTELRIRLGPKAKKVREGRQAAAASA